MNEIMDKMGMMHNEPSEAPESGELEAKMEVLKQLHEMMSSILEGDLNDMGGMEKVEVMASDEEGLEQGLDKAQELMKKRDDSEEDIY